MRTAAAVVVLLLAAVLLGLSWYLGGRAEAAYRQALAQMSAQGMRLSEERYERGWFGSRALAKLQQETGPGGMGGGEALRVRIASRIMHGPWHLDALRPVPVAAIVESRLDAETAGQPGTSLPTLLVTTQVELNGSGLSSLRIPAVARSAGFGAPRLRRPESRGEVRFAPGFEQVEGRYELDSLDFSSEGGAAVSIQGLSSESAGARGAGGLFAGSGKVKVGQVRVSHPDGDLDLRGLYLAFESTARNRLMDVRLDLDLDRAESAGRSYGPGKMVLAVTGFPAADLADLSRAAAEVPGDPSTGVGPASAAGLLLPYFLPAILLQDPRIAVESLEVETPDGRIEARLSVGTRGMTREAIERPGAWLTHLVGKAELRLPKSLTLELLTHWHRDQVLADLRKRDPELVAVPPTSESDIAGAAGDQLDALLRGGWGYEESGQVATNLRLADAVLTINGKTFPVTGLVAP